MRKYFSYSAHIAALEEDDTIVGGYESRKNSVPYQVSLYTGYNLCGRILLSSEWVLSTSELLFIVTAVFIPPQADTKTTLKELHWTLCKLETIYPEAAFIVAGDFKTVNLRTRLPKFYQHIDCTTHGGNTLDQYYSNFRDAYKALPSPPFDKSDHDAILLLPSYR
uniref:Peptidase S1 domain-containing protein n=1 Tax=Oncorhynchus tshawytscha TaxID=74940 RepID=A0A8C8M9L2_ONCTS